MDGWEQITVSLWMNRKQYGTRGTVLARGVLNDASVHGVGISAGGTSGGTWTTPGGFAVATNQSASIGVNPPTFGLGVTPFPALDHWYHIVGTYDGTNMSVYVDGVLESNRVLEVTETPIWDNDTTEMVIGNSAGRNNWTDYYFDGLVDDVKIYRRALSATEVAQEYNAIAGAVGPILHYEFDLDNGANVVDSGSEAHDGIATGATLEPVVAGSSNLVRRFAPDVNYITVTDENRFRFGSNDFSVAMWINPSQLGPASIRTLASKYDADSREWALFVTPDGQLMLQSSASGHIGGDWTRTTTDASITAGFWQHVVMVKRGSDADFYKDGRLLTETGQDAYPMLYCGTAPVRFGAYRSSTGIVGLHTYLGLMDDARIYDRALTPAEIAELSIHPPDEAAAELVIDGTPTPEGSPAPLGYGTHAVLPGTDITNSVATPVTGDAGERFACTGWTGTGSVPESGTEPQVVFTLTTNSTLTWHWQQEFFLDVEAGSGGTATPADGWYTANDSVHLVATPSNGYVFVRWQGTFAGGSSGDNPLTIVMDRPQTVTAIFEVDLALTNGLALYYSFDENEDGVVTDLSGNGHTGTVFGANWTPAGKAGGAYDFNGVSDYISTTRAVPNVSDVTITAWIKVRAFESPEGARRIYVQCPNPGFVDLTHSLGFSWQGDARTEYTAGYYPEDNAIYASNSVSSNVWTFVAVTRHNNQVTHYLNGRDDGRGMVVNYTGGANGNLALVGARAYYDEIHQHFDGLIDELRIYNRALSSEEVDALYRKPADDLVLHYDFDNDDGTNVWDKSGNDYHAHCVGNVTYEAGIHGSAARFTDRSTYILSPSTWNVDGWKQITVSLWMNRKEYGTRGTVLARGVLNDASVHGVGISAGGTSGGTWTTPGGFAVATNQSASIGINPPTFGLGVTPFPALDHWYHMVGTYDGTNMSVYVDGVLESNRVVEVTGTPLWDSDTTEMVIGNSAGRNNWTDYYFDGLVDDVKIYRRALSAAEVAQEYNAIAGDGGPVLHYEFDQDNGTNVVDSGSETHDGIATGATLEPVVAGSSNLVRRFAPDVNYITVTDESRFRFGSNDFSVAMWISPSLLGPTYVRTLASKYDADSREWVLFITPDGQLMLQTSASGQTGGDWTRTTTDASITTGLWQHVVLVRRGSNADFYKDGELLTGTGQDAYPLLYSGTAPVRFGAHRSSTGILDIHSYLGLMDDARIYDRALTPAEIAELSVHPPDEATAELVIDGAPTAKGSPMPLGYGTHTVLPGTEIMNTVATPIAGDAGERFVCTGWTGTGSVPVSGTEAQVVFTLTTNSSLTWQWQQQFFLDTDTDGNGSLDITDGWHVAGSTVVIHASPSDSHSFSGWTGDVPTGSETDNPLTLTVDQPRAVTAMFEPVTRTMAGRVFYSGAQEGNVYVEAFSDADYTHRVTWTSIVEPGNYAVNGLPDGGDYWIRAWLDDNDSGLLDTHEPVGGYHLNPIRGLAGDLSGVDITLIRLSQPHGVVARGGVDCVIVQWDANPEPGIAGYNVYRFDYEWGMFERLNNAPITELRFVDRAVRWGETYFYYVSAVVQSEYMSDYLEGPASMIVGAEVGAAILWMPDFNGGPGDTVRLSINARDAEGILGNDMRILVSYNPALLTPITQVNGLETVEKTVITQHLTVSNNADTADGILEIATGGGNGAHATLRILGCAYGSGPNRPTPLTARFSLDAGTTWTPINMGNDINKGRSYAVDLPVSLSDATNCILWVKEWDDNRIHRSDDGTGFVRILRNGDVVTNLPGIYGQADLAYYVRDYIDSDMVVNIGSNDALYLFEMSNQTSGPVADYQDLLAYVEFNEGAALVGQGHLFNVIFQVAPGASPGATQTNTFVDVTIRNQAGEVVYVDYSDTATFTVQNEYMLGDVDGDGTVTVSGDKVLAMRFALGKQVPTAQQLAAGDIDGDGKITKDDVMLILRIAHGLPINPEGQALGIDSEGSTPNTNGYLVSIGTYELCIDETVLVPIEINNADGVAAVKLTVNFDDTALSLQSVSNSALTAGFALDYQVNTGHVDIVMADSTPIGGGGGGVLCYLVFHVRPGANVGETLGLSIARCELADEYGADLQWASSVVTSSGAARLILSDSQDSDGDGLSDYAEQMADGSAGYSPWHAVNNPYGTDTDPFNADTDGDGMSDGDEVLASCSAINPADLLDVRSLSNVVSPAAGFELQWPTKTGVIYRVDCSTNLLMDWTSISPDIPGSGGTEVFVDTNRVTGPKFYIIKAWPTP